MHDIFSREPDPLEGLLHPTSVPPENEALRQAVYARTRRVLRRRRVVRQVAYAAAVTAAFALGFLVLRLVSRPNPSPQPDETVKQLPSPRGSEELPAPVAAEPALVREWQAFDSEDHRGELYRQAGDLYLDEEHDLQSALRCYTNALDTGTKQDLTISADDNWLLMAIKNARQKESDHAKTGG
ncbi:MAG TPA: hypothetical protein VH643_16780 [Gemmataceae bacterium]|jgi:hypothetical protein